MKEKWTGTWTGTCGHVWAITGIVEGEPVPGCPECAAKAAFQARVPNPDYSACFAEVSVTHEMREIGGDALRAECSARFGASWSNDIAWDFAEVAYRAMRALEPPRDGDFQVLLAAYREQYALRVERTVERDSVFAGADLMRRERDAAIAELTALRKAFVGPKLSAADGEKHDAVLIWWPRAKGVPWFTPDGEPGEVATLRDEVAALKAELAELTGSGRMPDIDRRYWPAIDDLPAAREKFGATEPWQYICMKHGIWDRHESPACPACSTFVDPDPAKPWPFREFGGDRRRVGG